LERKKVIANLSELNKKILKIPAMDKVIEEEKMGLPFGNEQICKKIQNKLKTRLEKAEKKSRLPKTMDINRFNKLNIVKKINLYFWYWPDGGTTSRETGRKN
jgi:acetyl-CoA carboxylase alpha subunit